MNVVMRFVVAIATCESFFEQQNGPPKGDL